MKKALKIMGIVLSVLIVVLLVASIVTGVISYPFSLMSFKEDNKFTIENNAEDFYIKDEKGLGKDWFNYFGVKYSTDSYMKGTIVYGDGFNKVTEEFFLEPGENKLFYSFINGFLDNKKARIIYSVEFDPCEGYDSSFVLHGFDTFNRDVPDREIFIETDTHKLGIDLRWGGALSYLEDLNSSVEAVIVDGKTKVDSNASERYKTEAVSTNVNLINRNDTGRLVQQSYYGTIEYDHGVYNDTDWRYNPVQGGNQFNDASKIVDLKITKSSIYVKCRPLDWAREKEYITPSYMEATYSVKDGVVHASCRFVDFSGYPSANAEQEIPAFYCIEPLNNFVYYGGDEPWTDAPLTNKDDLIFWPDAGYPKFNNPEHWAAFTGEFEDSFGIGVYVPDETLFLSGVFTRGETSTEDPSTEGPTSYIAVVRQREFTSFEPYEYTFCLATGTAEEIRNQFKTIDN